MADNKKMILNLFAGMQDALFLGDRFAHGEFVSFLQPGQFISTSLQENAHSDDMWIQSQIANILIDSSYVNKFKDTEYSGGTELLGSVDQVYSDVLNQAALPHKELSPKVLQEISDLKNWMADNDSNYELYRDRYFDAVEAYEAEAHNQNPTPGRLQRLAQKKLDAYSKWEKFGNKRMYDLKYGRFIYLTGDSPESYWARLSQKLIFHINQSSKGDYLQTFLIPSISSWSASSWATFERNISETDIYEYSKSTSWSAGLSGRWGLWSFGGGASGSTNYNHSESKASTVSLKFDYLRVRIARPWLTEDVFGYRFWTFKKEFGGRLISDGGNLAINPPIRPIGRMPIIPRYLIIVRNVEISASFSEEEKTFYSSQIQSKASVGWGPFSVSGSYSESTSSKYVHASFDGSTFRIQQPQIIARTGIMLPKSPNPIPELEWQGDEWIPENFSKKMKDEIQQIRLIDYFNSIEEELRLKSTKELEEVGESMLSQRIHSINNQVENELLEELKKNYDGQEVTSKSKLTDEVEDLKAKKFDGEILASKRADSNIMSNDNR